MSYAEQAATDLDPIVIEGETLGYVDRDGNIRRADDRRIVGPIANDRDHAVGVLHDRYRQYVNQMTAWIDETRGLDNKVWRLADCERHLREVNQQYVLGDTQPIAEAINALQAELAAEQQSRILTRNDLIKQAKALKDRTDWKETAASFESLNQQFKSIGSAGDREQDQQQWDTFREHEREFRANRKADFEKREATFAERAAAKEAICAQAEQFQDSSDFKAVGAHFRDLMDQWKQIGFAGRDNDDALWTRFNTARDAFNARRNEWFAANAAKKEELAQQAEALTALEDSAAAHQKMKPLMDRWRATGSAGKDADDALWQRFRSAQELVFTRSRAVFDARAQEREANYTAKEQLVREAEGLLAQDSRTATQRCKELQHEWKKIGPVPREKNEAQWQRFRAACDSVFRVAAEHGKRRQADARDKAEEQIRKLSAEIDEHERKIEHWQGVIPNLRDGDKAEEICENMEAKIATANERIKTKLGWIEEHYARMTQSASRR